MTVLKFRDVKQCSESYTAGELLPSRQNQHILDHAGWSARTGELQGCTASPAQHPAQLCSCLAQLGMRWAILSFSTFIFPSLFIGSEKPQVGCDLMNQDSCPVLIISKLHPVWGERTEERLWIAVISLFNHHFLFLLKSQSSLKVKLSISLLSLIY